MSNVNDTSEAEPSSQSSTTTAAKELSPEEYFRILTEACKLRMPPYDFRVWDRYLFSRCTSKNQTFGLLRLYDWVLDKVTRCELDSHKIGEWCVTGQFAGRVQRIIRRAMRSPSQVDSHLAEEDRMKEDLEFIRWNQVILDLGPMNISSVEDSHQMTWLRQAKNCATACQICCGYTPFVALCDECDGRLDYLIIGVFVWRVRPQPEWVLQDCRLDLWYYLGFVAVHFLDGGQALLTWYQSIVSKERGIAGDILFKDWRGFDMHEWASKNWTCEKSNHRHVQDFMEVINDEGSESVYRLCQMVALSEQDYHRLVGMDLMCLCFRAAKQKFRLIREFENEEVDPITRKNIYSQVLKHIGSPKELYDAWQQGDLREFVKSVYDKLEMPISERELDLIDHDSIGW